MGTEQGWYVSGASTDGSHVDIKEHGRGTAVCNGVPIRAAGIVVEEHNAETEKLRARLNQERSMIDWHAIAHHYRSALKNTSGALALAVQRCAAEHTQRVTLVNAMTELLPIIAGNGDPHANQCFVCDHDHGHAAACAYIRALEAVAEAGRSVED